MSLNRTTEYKFSTSELFHSIPSGILITDTYNGEYGVDHESLRIDTYSQNINLLKEMYYRTYNMKPNSFLPYHFVVERIGDNFVTYNTRPISYRSNVTGFNSYIVIAVIGDSLSDIYTSGLYHELSNVINGLRHTKPFSTKMRKNTKIDPIIENGNLSINTINSQLKG